MINKKWKRLDWIGIAAMRPGRARIIVRATKLICEQALHYLDVQRLPPSPQNYWLAFTAFERGDSEPSKKLAAIIDGGVRLTQADADALYLQLAGRAATDNADCDQSQSNDAIRHQTLRLADLATSATAVTGEFSRELTDRLAVMASAEANDLTELVAATLQRTQRAEQALEATSAELEQLRQQLEVVQGDAARDALTGLPNRRAIDAQFTALRTSLDPVFIAMCDIDRFKSYNDRFGHSVGDRVIKMVAQCLRETLPSCFVGRWGGEEFLVIGRCDVSRAVNMLEDAKAALSNRHFKLRETDQPLGRITFSAGLTSLTPGEDPAAAADRSDALLYRAKDAGRDRVLAA